MTTRTAPERPVADPVSFSVMDVTGTKHLDYEGVDGYRLVSDLAASVAAQMELPNNVPYSIRDDERASMLADDVPLGQQIPANSARLVVLPKSHLG